MSYMCSSCTMSVREDACLSYSKCYDGSECSSCAHLPECHEPGLEFGEALALSALADFFSGRAGGFHAAAEALAVVAEAIALRSTPFDWGEHRIGDSAECSQCGGAFGQLLGEKGCSAVE